jgi:hypothetical protein
VAKQFLAFMNDPTKQFFSARKFSVALLNSGEALWQKYFYFAAIIFLTV